MRRLLSLALLVLAACGSQQAPAPSLSVATFALTQPVSATAGVEVTFVVAALDMSGAVVSNYRGTVQFASDDTQGITPADVTFTAADAGRITARAVFKTAGQRAFVVEDKATPGVVGIVHLLVLPAPASRLALSGAPASTVAGAAVTVGVTTIDPYQNVATGFSGTVHFDSTDPAARLPPDSAFAAADAGTRTFQLALTRAATTAITVSAAGLAPATVTIAVAHGPAANLTLAGLPAQTGVDVVHSVTVTVRDTFGNPVTDYAGTIRFTNSDPQGSSIPDTGFVAADLGVRIVPVQFGTAGTQSLTASDTVAPAVTGSASTQVVHGPASGLSLTGIPSSTVAGTPLSGTVAAVDRHGNVVTDFNGTVHFASNDPAASLPVDYAFAVADLGSHAFPVVLTNAATSSVSVTSAGLTASTVTVAVAHAAPAQVTFEGLPAQVAVDATQNLTVRVRDAFGNLVTEYAGTLHFANSDPAASPIPDATFVPSRDLGARVIAVAFRTAGPQRLLASDTSTSSLSGSASTSVLHGPVVGLVLAGVPPAVIAGTPLTVTASAVDGRGNVATDFLGTVHFGSSDPNAALPVDYAFTPIDLGSHSFQIEFTGAATSTVTISSAGLAAASATIVVGHAAAARVTLEGLPAQVVAGVDTNLTVTVRDAFANPATNYSGTLRFTSSDPQAPAIADVTFTAADGGVRVVPVLFGTTGSQSVSATDLATPAIQGSAATLVLHGPAARLTLPAFPTSTTAGTILPVTVTAVDNRGNVVTDFAGTVHFASTDATAQLPADYLFVPADTGSRTFPVVLTKAGTTAVTVSSASLPATSSSVAVSHAGATLLTLSGLPAQVAVDVSTVLTLAVRDSFENVITDYTGTVRFTNTDAQAPAIPDTTFAVADSGIKAVAVKFATAGKQTLSGADTLTPSIAGSVSTQVLHGPAAQLTLAGLPASTVSGTLLVGVVTAIDAHGNAITDFAGTVHFNSTDAAAQLPADYTFLAGDAGSHPFPMVLATAGPASVSVGQPGGTAAGATVGVAVVNAPASRIVLTAHALRVPVDTNAVFTVAVRDRFGNPALDYRGTVHFTTSDPAATALANVAFTQAMSATTDVTLQFGTAGDQSLLATDTVDPAVGGSGVVAVTNGPAVAYTLSGLPTSAVAGEPLSLAIKAVDAHGNTALDYAGSAAVTSTDASDRLPAPGPFLNGVRSVSIAFVTTGAHRATVSEVLGTMRADTSSVEVVSGNASALVVADGAVTAGTAGLATVAARDTFGNLVASYVGTVTLTSTDGQAVLPAPYTFTALDAGQHTLSVTLKTAGTSIVIAADAANALSGSGTFRVAPAAAASCDLVVVGRAASEVAFRVHVLDPFANLASGYRGTVSFSSSDAAAQLPAPTAFTAADAGARDFTAVLPTAGDQTLRAADAVAPFSCQATVSIVTSPFFAVTFVGSESWAGTARTATVQAQDAAGAPIANHAGTIVFSSSDPAATLPAPVTLTGTEGGRATVNATFNGIGLQTFTASDSVDPAKTGSGLQQVHGLSYTDPASGGRVRLVVNPASTASVVQLDLVSNTTLSPAGLADPLNGRVLPSTVRNGVFAAGMNLPLDTTKVGPDTQLLVPAQPANLILGLGGAPRLTGAAFSNGVLYTGISQKRFDSTATCTAPCTNDHLRGDVQVRPFPGLSSLYYSLRLKLTPGAAPGTVFDGQALAADPRFRAAVRDRSGSDVFSGATDFSVGKLELK